LSRRRSSRSAGFFFGGTSGIIGLCGILAAALAAGTIYCTGMIYASWRSRPASGW
jgi:hypothetical protein